MKTLKLVKRVVAFFAAFLAMWAMGLTMLGINMGLTALLAVKTVLERGQNQLEKFVA